MKIEEINNRERCRYLYTPVDAPSFEVVLLVKSPVPDFYIGHAVTNPDIQLALHKHRLTLLYTPPQSSNDSQNQPQSIGDSNNAS